jgi:hypothetical protein
MNRDRRKSGALTRERVSPAGTSPIQTHAAVERTGRDAIRREVHLLEDEAPRRTREPPRAPRDCQGLH